jgi:hypothetical protein
VRGAGADFFFAGIDLSAICQQVTIHLRKSLVYNEIKMEPWGFEVASQIVKHPHLKLFITV